MSKQLRIWLFVLLGTLLTSTSLPAQGVITMTTSKSVGVSLYIGIEANGNVSIEGVKESARTDGVQHFYTLTNQKIVIRGDVTQLNCYWNQLTSLDVSGCIALTKLDCSRNELTSLDVSDCTSLTTLICRDNQLTSLDVSGCTALTKLECWQNKLTSLNVSGCTALTQLLCETNNLSSLYVSSCTSLTELNCWQNELTSLDVSKNTSLTELQCSRNKLTSLDLSKNTALTELYCSSNQLTSLDVSKNTALTKLYCGNNQLTSLDVSKNTALTKLWCYNNQLTSLDVSKNTALTDLDCSDNQLTSLDVSKNISLTKLECYKNRLKGEAMVLMVAGLFDRSGEEPGSLSIVCDEAEENNILRSEILTASRKNWRVFKYIVRTRKSVLYSGDGDGEIVMTTTQEQSLAGSIRLAILADGDVTIEGVKERKFFTDGSEHTYTLAGTQITIRGNVSELDCSKNQLTNIDVSKSTSLWILKCSDNKLTSLNTSGSSLLTEINCSRNQLTSLNVSGCTALTKLSCSDNQLTNLDVSGCTALTKLSCNTLISLNASGCTALTELDCSKNSLTSLNLSNCTSLKKFTWYDGKLTSLDMSGCTALTELYCRSNQLTSLNVSGCTALTELYCYSNQINGEAMTKLVNSLPDRKGMSSGTLQVVEYSSYKKDQNRCSFADVATASEKNWEVLKHVRDESNWESYLGIGEGVITMTTSKAVGEKIELRIEANGDVVIEGVSEMPYLSERYSKTYTLSCQTITIRGDVTSIDCYNNRLVSLNVSGCTALTELNCNNNYLTSLDVSGCTALTKLDCFYNPLIRLNLSNCTSLKKFIFYDGKLTSLDVLGCTALTELSCWNNQLTSLNVSGCTALTELYCRSNQLTSLDVSSCTSLTKFICRGNQLTSLDVSSCTSLTELSCWDNQLTSLDVSKNTALTELDCKANQLTSLDVSKNTALTYLRCSENQLTSLNVSGCTSLIKLDCSNNQLTSLNVSDCPALKILESYANQIKGQAMTQLVTDLPTVTSKQGGHFYVVWNLAREGNVCTATDVAKARAKGWRVIKTIERGGKISPDYIDYEGEDETQEVGQGFIGMITTKAIGETLELTIKANGRVTIEGVKPFLRPDGYIAHYTLTSQNIIIRGDVTEFECGGQQLTYLLVGCDSLTTLKCYNNQLTSLKVSDCTALTELYCSSNRLTSLDLSGCTALTELSCNYNPLTNINLSNCKSLKKFSWTKGDLTSLNVSGCSSLTNLDCNKNQLTKLDLRNCTSLTELNCSNNKLTSLDVSGYTSLTELACANNQLTSLNVSGCTALAYVECFLNRLKREVLTELVNNLPDRKGQKRGELYILYDGAREGNGTLLRTDVFATMNKNWALGKGSGRNWQYYTGADVNTIAMTTTQDQLRKGFITLAIVADGDVSIDGVYENRIATDGSEKKYTLSGNQITIRGKVTKLHCSNNQLTSLNLFYSSILEELECAGNLLTELDLSGCESLKKLSYTNGQLNSLNLFDCVSLTELDCSKNELTSLDLSDCTALTSLDCRSNRLGSLDLSDCTSLTSLACSRNKLESLDLSACTRLESLACYRNKIRGKAVAQLVESLPDRYGKEPGKFYFVYYSKDEYEENFCYRPAVGRANDKNWRPQKGHNNGSEDSWEDYFGVKDEGVVMMRTAQEVGSQITLTLEANGDVAIDGVKGVPVTDGKPHQYTLISQDVTIRGYVTKLHCSGNKLTSLDLSTTVPLVELDCSNNQLTALDVSQNAAVTSLTCYRNQIKGDAMAQLIKGLPQLPLRSTHLFGIVSNAADEGNVFLKADVERVREKGWSPMKWDEERHQYEPYAGKETETFAVTLTKEGKGTITATGANDLTAVPYGTELKIVATPAAGYKLTALTANGEDILATKKVVVKGATEVKATFVDHTGVETTVTQQIQLYPNPATDYLLVEGVAPASEVTLHSLTGERLYAGRADSRGVLQIDLTPYADGVYLVCVAGETYRVVVRR